MELHTSETISDTSNTSTNNELSLSFDIDNGGTETVYVEDKLLTNYDIAKARAESVFLDEGYINNRVTISTYHIDNLHIGDPIQIDGLLFKVISAKDVIKGAKVSMEITAERFIPPPTYIYDGDLVLIADTDSSYIFDICEHSDGYLYAVSGNTGIIYKSLPTTDVWTVIYDDSIESAFQTIISWNGYLYIGSAWTNGKIMRSTNGSTWSTVYDSTSSYFNKIIAHTDGYLYAGANNGVIYRSNDGSTWNAAWSGVASEIRTLYSHTDGYIYCGTGNLGKLYRSNDGTTWSEVNDFTDLAIISIIYFSGAFIVGTTNGKVYRSVDLITWTLVFTPSLEVVTFCEHTDGYLYLGLGGNGAIYKTIDGITWTLYLDTPESYIYKLFQASNGRFYAGTSTSGRIYANTGTLVGGE